MATTFHSKIESALEKVKTILENHRKPKPAEDVQHSYEDKFLLAEYLTNLFIAAEIHCFDMLGATQETTLKELIAWQRQNKSVTIRFNAAEYCEFVKKETRKEEAPTAHVTEYSGFFGKAKKTEKVIHTITEYFWTFRVNYCLIAFQGNDVKNAIELTRGEGEIEIITRSEDTPKPKVSHIDPIDLNITWLLQQLDKNNHYNFSIKRDLNTCRTPRRNEDVAKALSASIAISNWNTKVNNYFLQRLFPVQANHGLDLSQINSSTIFNPIIPLFEAKESSPSSTDKTSNKVEQIFTLYNKPTVKSSNALISIDDVHLFLAEQKRSTMEKLVSLSKIFPETDKLIGMQEARLCLMLQHSINLAAEYATGATYIEEMLRQQFIAAIGKIVTATDFAEYMQFHYRKLYKDEFKPLPFSHTVRRPDHTPEGELSILADKQDGSIPQPILTVLRKTMATTPMKFAINAATDIAFYGERFVHGYVENQFSGKTGTALELHARARQFSCFMLLVGKITGASTFEPVSGIIIQNKDDLKLPLLLEQIPTPKEFRDAIESLSPEQQRFAKAFRSMQLEGSLFGLCVLQIKPQLEKVLKLPDDSLTKEIKLTQDLIELFVTYQIPCDLLSYDGTATASADHKLNVVKKHTENMQSMIRDLKMKQLSDRKQERLYDHIDRCDNSVSNNYIEKTVLKELGDGFGADVGGNSVVSQSGIAGNHRPVSLPSDDKVDPQNAGEDYTKIPTKLDKQYELYDEDNAIHPTIVKAGNDWVLTSQKALLAEPSTSSLSKSQQESERNRCFDLLDALSKSGILSFDQATLHIIVAATHSFYQSLLETVIQDNVNPIEKVERSSLIVASTIYEKDVSELVNDNELTRVQTYSANLFK